MTSDEELAAILGAIGKRAQREDVPGMTRTDIAFLIRLVHALIRNAETGAEELLRSKNAS